MKRLQHGLVDIAAHGDQIIRLHLAGVFPGRLQAARAPVNCVRLGEPPVERAIAIINGLRECRVHFVFAQEHLGISPGFGGGRVDQAVQISSLRAEQRRHFRRPLPFIKLVPVVKVCPHLVLKKPGQLAIEKGIVRVVAQAVIPQQFDAAFHPAPAVRKIAGPILLELDRDVIGHIPGLEEPDLGETRLQLGDPGGQLRRLEKLVVLLQVVGPDPKHVGDQAAEAAQRNRRKSQHGRRIVQRPHPRQPQPLPVAIQGLLHLPRTEHQCGGEQQPEDFFCARAHDVPGAVASSRR